MFAPYLVRKLRHKSPSQQSVELKQDNATLISAKQVIAVLVIQDTKITKGKICAQVGHAVSEAVLSDRVVVNSWKA